MSPLALKNSTNLDIGEFDLKEFFFTDTLLFKRLKMEERIANFLERVLAFFLFIFLIPLFIGVSLLIRVTMGSGVLFSQTRVGKDGLLFSIYKFRTMIIDAEIATGAVLSSKNDPRVTYLGRILRASHIDELPQLINVLKGEMSFVGPRPERPEFVNQFQHEIENYHSRHIIRPGITGLAQICLPYDATAKEKLQFDQFYITHRHSVLLNVMISCYTGLKMITFFKS